MIGSPSVFHTAPPQPASKARMTCSPEFAGGADASQKGFGLLMPAKSTLRSAIVPPREERARRVASIRNAVHDLLASVDAVATGEDLGVARCARLRVGDDE